MAVERAVPGETSWPELAAPHLARYFFAAEMARGARVLDAGCGSGYGARILKAAGAAQVQAIDLDPAAVAWAEAHFGGEGIEYLTDNCQGLERVRGPFDLICNFENLEHLAAPEQFLAAAAERLAPGGTLVVSSPDRASTPPFVAGRPHNPYHVHEWYAAEFAHLLRTYFEQVELRVQVESTALAARRDAVAALRQGLMWSNPLAIFLWRKLSRRKPRPWTRLEQLAAPAVGDYPIVEGALAPLLGCAAFHIAICREPRRRTAGM